MTSAEGAGKPAFQTQTPRFLPPALGSSGISADPESGLYAITLFQLESSDVSVFSGVLRAE